MYAVVGITGQTGYEVATALRARGHRVRGVTRDKSRLSQLMSGLDQVSETNLLDRVGMAAALAGVDAAYVVIPSVRDATDYLATCAVFVDSLAWAIEASDIDRVVLLSSIGAHLPAHTGPILAMHAMEQRLGEIPGVHFLRAGYFVENWAPAIEAALTTGLVDSFFPADHCLPMVSVRDVGETAAQMMDMVDCPDIVELDGPDRPTPADVVIAASRQLSLPLSLNELPIAGVTAQLRARGGVGESWASLSEEMIWGLRAGRIDYELGAGTLMRRGTFCLEEGIAYLLSRKGFAPLLRSPLAA